MSIGVGITTYNHEDYFSDLYNSLPLDKIDELVVVNGGDVYMSEYDCHWIQHHENKFPSTCRNECVSYLLGKKCDNIFLIEDDMIIKDHSIFDKYIQYSNSTGIEYFSFVSTSYGTGTPGNRTPKSIVKYSDDISVNFYGHMCNEFTYHKSSRFENVGLYDSNMREAFDVELTYRYSLDVKGTPFWWFPDIPRSDDLVMNNPNAISRLQADDRPDGSRKDVMPGIIRYFTKKHNLSINEIPRCNLNTLKSTLRYLYNERNSS